MQLIGNNGLFVGTDVDGNARHSVRIGSTVYAAERQPDGTFGPLYGMWTSPNNFETHGTLAQAVDINHSNQILGFGIENYGNGGYYTKPGVFDFASKKFTDFSTIEPGLFYTTPVAIDDQGRVLLYAEWYDRKKDDGVRPFLFIPNGLATEPVTVPEPTTLATFAVFLTGALALRGRRLIRF